MGAIEDMVLQFDIRIREIVEQLITPVKFGTVLNVDPIEIELQGTERNSGGLTLKENDGILLLYVTKKLVKGQFVLLLTDKHRVRYIVIAAIDQNQVIDDSGDIFPQVFDDSIAAAATTKIVADKLIGTLQYHYWEIISKDANTLEGITHVWILRDSSSNVSEKIEEIGHTRASTVVVTDNGDGTYDIDITNDEGAATVAYSGILIRTGKTGSLEL